MLCGVEIWIAGIHSDEMKKVLELFTVDYY
jgi:hypothetical protein